MLCFWENRTKNPTFRNQLVNSGILIDIKYFILDEAS